MSFVNFRPIEGVTDSPIEGFVVNDTLWCDGPAASVVAQRCALPTPAQWVEANDASVSHRLKSSGLIQQVNRVELPAPGRWSIMARQRLNATKPWSFRASAVETVSGTLDVDDGRLDAIMTFVARASNRPSFHIGYSGRLIDADRCGRWSFSGSAIVDGHGIPELQIAVTYLGVHDRGAAPVAVLQLNVCYRYPRLARRLDGRVNARRTAKVAAIEPSRAVDQTN